MANFKVNIMKAPLAIFHFFLGCLATYISWNIVPLLFNAIDGAFPTLSLGILQNIGWVGMVMLSIIYMIVYPLWILFEEEEGVNL